MPQAPNEVLAQMEAFPSDIFTMVESNGSCFLMRGKICFAEIRQEGAGTWRIWGYGLDAGIGSFESWPEAGRAAVKSAWATLNEAGLTLAGEK